MLQHSVKAVKRNLHAFREPDECPAKDEEHQSMPETAECRQKPFQPKHLLCKRQRDWLQPPILIWTLEPGSLPERAVLWILFIAKYAQ